MDFQGKIATYIKQNDLIPCGSKVVVALSGGADSVALLVVLQQLGYSLIAAHCNFHLRGAESDRDEAFVRDLALRRGVPCRVKSFDTVAYARANRCSIEMAARELRYAWFEQLRQQEQAAQVAVAHHCDDSVETILLNLLRGTGIHGLTGISPKRGAIVRPLLAVSRAEIERYLQSEHESFVTDCTNLQDEYTRNKIRLHLLPLMEDINPSVRQSLLRLSDNLSEIVAYTDEYLGIEQQRLLGEEKSCSIEALLQTKMPRTLLYQWLQNYGFNRVRCNQIYQSLQHDRSNLFLSETHRLFKERGQLYLTGLCKEWSPRTITEGESLVENEQGQQLEMSWSNRREEEVRTSDRCMVTVDADRLQFPLVWRKWRSGDIFQPLGMKGMKKVSDYLSDRKKTSWEKEQITVLCSGDRVVWLVGERLDHRFRVTEETTRLFRVKVV